MFEMDEKLVEECDYNTKLAVTQWVMKHIVEHAQEGGSYRYLIYERLGFGMDAYAPLCADGLTISNEFDLQFKDNVIKAYQSGDEKELKRVLSICDEPDCKESASCGFNTENGYRWTCSKHNTWSK